MNEKYAKADVLSEGHDGGRGDGSEQAGRGTGLDPPEHQVSEEQHGGGARGDREGDEVRAGREQEEVGGWVIKFKRDAVRGGDADRGDRGADVQGGVEGMNELLV